MGDINADGYDDVALKVAAAVSWVGVIFGGPDVARSGLFNLENLDSHNGLRIAPYGKPASAGDLNGDGVADLLSSNIVLFGGTSLGSNGVVDALEMSDGQHGFLYLALFSYARGMAGDVNNDGLDDVIVGRKYFHEACNVGRVHVVFGRRMGDGDLDADIDLADFGAMQACFGQAEDGDVPDACHPLDFDKDNDIDLTDFATFQKSFGTPP